jgi:hypothetical protein
MNFKLNEILVNSDPMGLTGEIVHDKPNVNVNSKELRISYIEGMVSLISITISSQSTPAELPAIRKEVFKNT